MSITPNIIMICIDIQGGGGTTAKKSKELYDFGGIPALNRNNQPIEIRVIQFEILSQGFVRSERAL
jgi:hypothetical protein